MPGGEGRSVLPTTGIAGDLPLPPAEEMSDGFRNERVSC